MQKYLQTETTILPAGLADGQKKGHIPKKKMQKKGEDKGTREGVWKRQDMEIING